MAFYRCFNGGGRPKETVLWENENPSKNFGAQVITLSHGMSNYDFIKVVANASTTSTTKYTYYFKVSDLMALAGSGVNIGGTGTISTSTNYGYVRCMSAYRSDTEIYFRQGHPWNSADNSRIIPVSITGIKY